MPPGRVINLPGRGEVFVRDTGEQDRPVVLLLHGWTATADLNWYATYRPLADAGYRVVALDHRGHGRGLRSGHPFRLADCADDAAALLDALGVARAYVVGYSMGGPIAQLMARAHPEKVAGLVLCATATNWKGPQMRLIWSSMAGLRLALGLAPRLTWELMMTMLGTPGVSSEWVAAELSRGSSLDIAEAGRELGRFDSRPWLPDLAPPAAVVVTTRDSAVPAPKQRSLARRLDAPVFEVHRDHDAAVYKPRAFLDALFAALAAVREREPVPA